MTADSDATTLVKFLILIFYQNLVCNLILLYEYKGRLVVHIARVPAKLLCQLYTTDIFA